MLVPGSTSTVMLSIVTLNNFFSSAIIFTQLFVGVQRNEPNHNFSSGFLRDLIHAIQTHRGNVVSLLPQAMQLRHQVGILYFLQFSSVYPKVSLYHSSCLYHIQYSSGSSPSILFLRGMANTDRSSHACKILRASSYDEPHTGLHQAR